MNQYIIELLLGLMAGTFSGITGIMPAGLLLILFDLLKIGDYKSNLGAIALLNLFPISLGSFFNFYKSNNVNYSMGFVLLFSIIVGGYLGSELVVDKKYQLSKKTIKYITATLGIIIFITFIISAYYEKDE
jgi:uncharacterized membrane protein YfcA